MKEYSKYLLLTSIVLVLIIFLTGKTNIPKYENGFGIGYAEDERVEIFGDLNDSQIFTILDIMAKDIMNGKEIQDTYEFDGITYKVDISKIDYTK